MSSTRRSAHEVNILAMLDRQSSGPLPRRLLRRFSSRPALLWYGAAGLLVCGLVGVLGWLARDGTPASVDTALAGSIKPAPQAPVAAVDTVGNAPLVPSSTGPAPGPAMDAAPPAGASIVDLAPAEPPAPSLAVPVPAPAHALPPQQAAGRIAVQAIPPRTGPRALQADAKAHPGAAATRNRRQNAAAKAPAGPAAVDTDVALISAIIQHANARDEAQEGCADKGCGARKP